MKSFSKTTLRALILLFVFVALFCEGVEGVSHAGQNEKGVHFTYDTNGNMATRTDAADNTISFKYDALDRLGRVDYPDRPSVRYQYDNAGRVVRMADGNRTTDYGYDIHDRLVSVKDPDGNCLRYQYNKADLLTGIIYPEGTSISYAYDASYRLKSVKLPSGIILYEYDDQGRLKCKILPNGVRSHYSYDSLGRLAGVKHMDGEGKTILGFEYEFDGAGHLTRSTVQEQGNRFETRYGYDKKSRLIRNIMPDGRTFRYQYDRKGNRLGMRSGNKGETTYEYDGRGYLTAVNAPEGKTRFSYDAKGNLVRKRGPKGRVVNYSWDSEDRLTKLIDGKRTIELAYDGNGLLARKSVNGKETRYVNDIRGALPLVAAQCSSPCRLCYWGLGPLGYREAGGGDRFFLDDGLGTVTGLTDSNGKLRETYSYDPFGQPLKDNPLRHAWVRGLPYDPDLGLAARQYDPAVGRSIQDLGRLAEKVYGRIETAADIGSKAERLHVLATAGGFAPVAQKWIAPKGQYELFSPLASRRPADLNMFQSLQRATDKYRVGPILQKVNDAFDVVGAAKGGYKAGTAIRQEMYRTAGVHFLKPFAGLLRGKVATWGSGLALAAGATASAPVLGLVASQAAIWGTAALVKNDMDLAFEILEARAGIADLRPQIEQLRHRGMCNLYDRGASDDEVRGFLRRTGVGDQEMSDYVHGSGGGPPGGGAALGGVSLDVVAKIFSNLRDVRGATFDPSTGQLILIGREDLDFPPMNLDDLVVAIRADYSGQALSISIEPCRPGVEDGCMKVHYNGRFQLPDHPDWGWVQYEANGKLSRTEAPAIFRTRFGALAFEADRYLKTASLGRDNRNPDERFQTNVRGFKSMLDRMAVRAASLGEDTSFSDNACMIQTDADRKRPSSCNRLWFVPKEVVVKLSADKKTMEFEPVRILTEARFVRFEPNGKMVDVPGDNQAVFDFVDDFNKHYMDFAAEKPELMVLIQLSKIVGLVRWIKENHIPVDLSWMDQYQVRVQPTPPTTPGLQVTSEPFGNRRIGIYGGVEFSRENRYRKNRRETSALGKAVLETRPSRSDITWTFQHGGETLRAVAIHLSPKEIRGGYAASRIDESIPFAAGKIVDFKLNYSSLNPADSFFGKGWSMGIPSLSFTQVPTEDAYTFYTKAVLRANGRENAFQLTREGAFRPQSPESSYEAMGLTSGDPFAPLMARDVIFLPGLPGKPTEVRDDSHGRVGYDGFAVLQKDGVVLAFNPSGRITGMKDTEGNQVTYEYSEGRLKAVRNTRRQEIRFTYDASGKLSELTTPNGNQVHYKYDPSGYLRGVSDSEKGQTAGYAYDEAGRLNRIEGRPGQPIRTNRYDQLGRVIQTAFSTGESCEITYDDKTNTTTYRSPTGSSLTRRFDGGGRLVMAADSDGRKIRFEYDKAGRLVGIMDQRGNRSTFQYGPNGFLTEIQDPLGNRTLFLNHNRRGMPGMVVDPADRMTLFEYDAQGNLIRESMGFKFDGRSGARISYSLVDPKTVSYQYDSVGNLVAIQHPDGALSRFTYDQDGNLVEIESPGGKKIRQVFDGDSRLKVVFASNGNQVAYTYDTLGQLVTMKTPVGTRHFQYAQGRLQAFYDTENQTSSGDNFKIGVRETLPTGATPDYLSENRVSFKYDEYGLVSAVVNGLGDRIEYGYDNNGRVAEITYQAE